MDVDNAWHQQGCASASATVPARYIHAGHNTLPPAQQPGLALDAMHFAAERRRAGNVPYGPVKPTLALHGLNPVGMTAPCRHASPLAVALQGSSAQLSVGIVAAAAEVQ